MNTQTGSISFESTGNFSQVVKQNYATLSQIKGQFAVCSTGASTAEKIATTVPTNADWTLYAGATVTVKFTSANTASVPTLNVNGTGPKEIRDYNANELLKAAREWKADAAIAFTYDGTYWRVQDSNLMERVYSAETRIDQNADQISLRATKSMMGDVVRNLLVGGSFPKVKNEQWSEDTAIDGDTWYRWSTGTLSKTNGGVRFDSTGDNQGFLIPLVANDCVRVGEQVTLSFTYRGTYTSTGNLWFIAKPSPNANNGNAQSLIADEQWHEFNYSWTVTAGTSPSDAKFHSMLLFYGGSTSGKWIEIKDGTMMLERGNTMYASQAELKITSDAIGLTASGTATIANPNLTPWFSMPLDDIWNATNNPNGYWRLITTSKLTKLTDGWAHVIMDNTSGTNTIYTNMHLAVDTIPIVNGTLLIEIRNYVGTTTAVENLWFNAASTSGTEIPQMINNSSTTGIGANGTYYHKMKPSGNTSPDRWIRSWFGLSAGFLAEFDARLSFYEGDYTGPYKPYTGNKLYTSQSDFKVTTDGISSEVSKINSVKYVNTDYSRPLATLKSWAEEGYSGSWTISTDNTIRVNDTVYIKCQDTTRNCPVYIKVKVTAVTSSSRITGTSHGYEDVLPVDTIKSTINQSSDTVKIQANHIEIDGTATFKNSDNTTTTLGDYLNDNYATQDAVNNLSVSARNLIRNGNFSNSENTKKYWSFENVTTTVENDPVHGNVLKIVQTTTNNNSWRFYPDVNTNFTHENGKIYSVSFYAKADADTKITVSRTGTSDIYGTFDLTTSWQRFEATSTSTGTGSLTFKLIGTATTWYISEVMLVHGNFSMDWSQDPRDVEDSVATLSDYTNSIRTWYAVCSTAAATAAKVATIDPVTSDFTTSILKPSTVVFVKFTTTNTAAVADLTLNINSTGAKPIKQVRNGTVQNLPGVEYLAANATYQFTYDGANWLYTGNYDSNSNDNARYVQFYNTIVAGENLANASIIGGRTDGKFYQIKENSSFDLSHPLLWLTTALNEGVTDYSHIYTQSYNRNLATYYTSFVNTTANKIVYLVGTVNGNTFSTYGSNSNSYLTVTPPTQEDGRFYIPIGRLGNQSNGKNYFNYQVAVPVSLYAFIDGKFRQVTPTEIVATQKIYYRSKVSGNVSVPKTWITSKSDIYNDTISVGINGWSTKVTPLSKDKTNNTAANKYLYLYTCEQRKRLDGTVECIPTDNALLDDSTTVIDGGNIITGTVTANQLNAANINASHILTVGSMTTETQGDILNSNIQIGGRNFVRNTQYFNGWTNCGSGTAGTFDTSLGTFTYPTVTANGWTEIRPNANILYSYVRNRTVTLSAEVKAASDTNISVMIDPYLSTTENGDRSCYRNVYLTLTGGSVNTGTVTADGTWQKVYAVVDIDDSFFSSGTKPSDLDNCYFGTRLARLNTNYNTYIIRHVMIEASNKLSDWSPAPEDIESTSTGLGIKWNYSAFSTANNGEAYLCNWNQVSGTFSDADGWVWFNGLKRIVSKGMVNPNSIALNKTIYVVCRLSSATATAGTNYIVWYNSGWKYLSTGIDQAASGAAETAWSWDNAKDMVLASFVMLDSDSSGLANCEQYTPPLTSQQVTSGDTAYAKAAAAQTTANTANNKATVWYGVSGGSWTEAAKTGTVSGFTSSHLVGGTTVVLRTGGSNNVADALTLNIQSTGAKAVYVGGVVTSASNQLLWHAGAVLTFTYVASGNGYWDLTDPPNTVFATRITDAAGTANKLVYSTNTIIRKGTILSTAFAEKNTAEAPMLGVAVDINKNTNLGWKPIYYGTSTNNRPTEENGFSWIPNTEVLLTFDGANWRMGGKTYIDGGHILTESISADKIKVSEIEIGKLDGYSGLNTRIASGESALTKANYYNRYAQAKQSTTLNTDKPWYKFAAVTITTQNTDRVIKFDVMSDMYGVTKYGTLVAHVRVGANIGSIDYKDFVWLDRNSAINPDKFLLVYKLTSGTSLVAELWCKLDEQGWHGFIFNQIYESGTENSPHWTLYQTVTQGSQAAVTSGYTQQASIDASTAFLTRIDENGIKIHPASTENNRVEIKAAGMQVYKDGYLKANYADTITLYGGSNASGANPKVELTSTDFKMTDSGGTQRLLLNSTNGAIIGKPDKGRTQITDAGMTVYDTNNKKRTAVNASGLTIYDANEVNVANFGTTVGTTGTIAFARIGESDSSRFEISPTTLSAYTGTTKYFEVSANSITYGSFVEKTITAKIDFNTLKTTGTYHIKVSGNTNAPTTGQGVLTVEWNVGTPYQIWQPDSTTTAYYKRKWTSSDSTWTDWTKIDAVDAAKTATSYITNVTSTNGIQVKSSLDNKNYIQLDSNGLSIYRNVSSIATKVAEFGATATIGATNNAHFVMAADNLQAFSSTNTSQPYFKVSASGLQYGTNLGNTAATTTQVQAAQNTADTALSGAIEYIVGTHGSTATNVWTGVTRDASISAGKQIAFYMTSAGTSSAATLNLTLSGGGTTGAKNVRLNNSNVTTHYAQYTVLKLTYDGTYWKCDNYNSDSTQRTKYEVNLTAAEAITNGHVICGNSSGYRNIAASVSFDLGYPLLYAGTAIAKGATNGTRNNNWLTYQNITYTNNGTITSGAAAKMLFLKGTLTGNTFKISASPFLTTVVPTSDDGLAYIPLGLMSSATAGYFESTKDVYGYRNGSFHKLDTVSNYMSFDSTNGLIIAQSSPSTTAYPLVQITPSSGILIKQSATSYSKITSSGMEIYVPVSSTATKVASFGTTATIGQTSTGRVEITSTGVGLYNKNNKMKVSIGTGNSIFYGGEGTYPYIELGTTATSAINIRQSATSYTSITSSGLDIYTTVSSAAKKIASFGTTATIGATDGYHTVVNTSGLHIWSGAESTATNELASFGSTARIGSTSSGNVRTTSTGISFYDTTHEIGSITMQASSTNPKYWTAAYMPDNKNPINVGNLANMELSTLDTKISSDWTRYITANIESDSYSYKFVVSTAKIAGLIPSGENISDFKIMVSALGDYTSATQIRLYKKSTSTLLNAYIKPYRQSIYRKNEKQMLIDANISVDEFECKTINGIPPSQISLDDHIHAASDITSETFSADRIPTIALGSKVSGTLPIANGGTGKTSHTINSVIIGGTTTTGALQNIATKSGAFYATSANGKPAFGTLPVAQGGTGKTAGTCYMGTLISKFGSDTTATFNATGSNGTVTLTETAANFTFIDIFFRGNDQHYDFTRVYQPDKKTANLATMESTAGYLNCKWRAVEISGTSIKTKVNDGNNCYAEMDGNGTPTSVNHIYICGVIGYK